MEKGPLDLSAPFEREITPLRGRRRLEALTVFSLDEVIPQTEGTSPDFNLIFSDDLDNTQDLTGLIQVEPHVAIS